MNKNLTELVFILDKSGSMSGMEEDTIGGFNSMIEKQKKEEGDAFVTTVLFSNSNKIIHDRVSLKKIEPMTEKDYTVGGGTALLDAIGDSIKHIETIHRYAREEDVPAHTLFIITTDGMENASNKYSSDDVKKMIKKNESEKDWGFLFLGANIDAVQTADKIGIRRERSANYRKENGGTKLMYDCVAEVACAYRSAAPINENWKETLDCEENKK